MENEKINKDEYDSMFSKIMNWITLKSGIRPNTYSIFVWIRQVNDRLSRIESNKEQGSISQRVEMEACFESMQDKLESRIDVLEQRINELETKVIELEAGNE